MIFRGHKCSHDDEPIRRGDSVLAPVFTIVDDAHHSSADEEEQPQANLMSFVVVFAPGEGSGGKELVQLHAKSTGAVTIALVFPSPCALVYDHQGEELLALESPISIDVGAFVPRLPGFRLILSQLCGRGWEIGALTLGKRMARLVQAITESDLETAYAAIDLVDSLNMLVPGENREAPLLAAVKRHHRLGASAAGDGFVQYLLEKTGQTQTFHRQMRYFIGQAYPPGRSAPIKWMTWSRSSSPWRGLSRLLTSKHLCNARDPEHLELLLKLPHMDPSRTSPEGWLPLIAALNRIELASVKLLIAAGADPTLPTYDGFCPLARAAFSNEDEEIL
ncbi:uncharacterized protein LOC9639596 [Selaginella moellendorffii]|uniref:uncharacterized protein LOC9639596 n=1 Tax=Selaginella moellendorffii TaxID=88036 RepID=UPI000D1C449D|nr:uncharacterized protein LOC9639596 [Selaginella moellendorffii]|eukprot:XP_024521025.1 uncharacterized protein LOC9639596 [Selaginella moellendorffii]